MNWQTIEVTKQGLSQSLQRIRAAGGTVTSCLRCGSGYRITCMFPGELPPLGTHSR